MIQQALTIFHQADLLRLIKAASHLWFCLQFAIILAVVFASKKIAALLVESSKGRLKSWRLSNSTQFEAFLLELTSVVQSIVTMALFGVSIIIYEQFKAGNQYNILFLSIANKLTFWYFLYQLFYFFSEHKTSIKMIFYVLLPLITLNYFSLLLPLCQYLDSLAVEIGKFRLSVLMVVKTTLVLLILIKLFSIVSAAGKKYIRRLRDLTYSTRELLLKFFQIATGIIFFFIALNILGIDVATFTVIGGALSFGLAFGLQKITSNFISGIILLFENSLRANDVIELEDGTFGNIKQITARYTLLSAYDGKEIIIPNEEFITKRVINWSFSNSRARSEFEIGVAYGSDYELVQRIMLEAARQHPNILQVPDYQPECFITNFAESAVMFRLRFWVRDIDAIGLISPKSDVMFTILREFKLHGIEIPFPQRTLRIVRNQA